MASAVIETAAYGFQFLKPTPLDESMVYTPMWKDAPLAPVALLRKKGIPDGWKVVRCPWCASTHTHGLGGFGGDDPRHWLGGRITHCLPRSVPEDPHGLNEYRLIGIEGQPTQEGLDRYFPIWWHRGLPARRQPRMGLHPPEIRDAVWKKSRGYCWYCGDEILPFSTYAIDHVLPLKLGGSNQLDNLAPVCRLCNSRKGAWHIEVFRTRYLPQGQFWFEQEGRHI